MTSMLETVLSLCQCLESTQQMRRALTARFAFVDPSSALIASSSRFTSSPAPARSASWKSEMCWRERGRQRGEPLWLQLTLFCLEQLPSPFPRETTPEQRFRMVRHKIESCCSVLLRLDESGTTERSARRTQLKFASTHLSSFR